MPADLANVDDVGFVSALLDELGWRDEVDRRRVFATGLSNGAFFSQRLGCELSDRVAAIAPVAGMQSTGFAPSCRPARPVSVLEVHGTDDPLVPYQGGVVRGRGGESSILGGRRRLQLVGHRRLFGISRYQRRPPMGRMTLEDLRRVVAILSNSAYVRYSHGLRNEIFS